MTDETQSDMIRDTESEKMSRIEQIAVPLFTVVVVVFVGFVGWLAYETYNQSGRLASVETELKNLDANLTEARTAIAKLDDAIEGLPASLHADLGPRLTAELQVAVATVVKGELNTLKAEVTELKALGVWQTIGKPSVELPEKWQAVIDGLNNRLTAIEAKVIQTGNN